MSGTKTCLTFHRLARALHAPYTHSLHMNDPAGISSLRGRVSVRRREVLYRDDATAAEVTHLLLEEDVGLDWEQAARLRDEARERWRAARERQQQRQSAAAAVAAVAAAALSPIVISSDSAAITPTLQRPQRAVQNDDGAGPEVIDLTTPESGRRSSGQRSGQQHQMQSQQTQPQTPAVALQAQAQAALVSNLQQRHRLPPGFYVHRARRGEPITHVVIVAFHHYHLIVIRNNWAAGPFENDAACSPVPSTRGDE